MSLFKVGEKVIICCVTPSIYDGETATVQRIYNTSLGNNAYILDLEPDGSPPDNRQYYKGWDESALRKLPPPEQLGSWGAIESLGWKRPVEETV